MSPTPHPLPGSPAALAAGCTCPHGERGRFDWSSAPWADATCPLHAGDVWTGTLRAAAGQRQRALVACRLASSAVVGAIRDAAEELEYGEGSDATEAAIAQALERACRAAARLAVALEAVA